jgi:hypothetical protein
MKTIKITTLITGILVALMSLTAHATEKSVTELSTAQKKAIVDGMGINKAFEINLIKNYLSEQNMFNSDRMENLIKVYNEKDELVFEGDANSKPAVLLKLSSDYLMEYDQVTYYRLHN